MGGGNALRADMEPVAAAIGAAERILVATHRNPDGDAIGSLLGLTHILRAIGKTPTPFCPDPLPDVFRFLPGIALIEQNIETKSFDISILLDTPETRLLPRGFPEGSRRGTFIVIDHHMRAEAAMGDLVIRTKASAVGEILRQMALDNGWSIGREAAMCLYTSIVADTSSFKYESAGPTSHLAAADLLFRGASPSIVAANLFESFSLSRQRLLGRVLETLTVSLDGRLAVIRCTQEMMRGARAVPSDTGGLINFARSIDGVVLAVFLREEQDGGVRISIRSKGRVNAGELAARMGGGGHVNAGGCTLPNTDIEVVARRIEKTAEVLLRENGTLS